MLVREGVNASRRGDPPKLSGTCTPRAQHTVAGTSRIEVPGVRAPGTTEPPARRMGIVISIGWSLA
jgi:hypothetical protein